MSLGTLGNYELLEKIAEGGMGELFRAREVGPAGFERIVALKRIRPSMIEDARSRQMFIEEARIASFVLHPNLVTLFRFEEEGDRLYLVTELVEGRDLGKLMARSRQQRDPLRIPLAVRIAEQVAQGLDYLHRLSQNKQPLQLVHRDVSPQNVLISFDGAVKLTDFGIAYMHRSEPLTQAGILKGKMGYLTPEQLSEAPVDGRADIFCLGIVLWEMLTGARLFQGTSDASILQQVLHKRIPLPSTLNVDVPPALDQVVMRALERDRARRFERAGDMAAALSGLKGWIATDADLGQELYRYFPEGRQPQGLPSAAPVEAHAESVSTAVDRPEHPETILASDVVSTVTEAPPSEVAPPLPPPPPPITAPMRVPRVRRRPRSVPATRALLVLVTALLVASGLGFWWRARAALSLAHPTAVLPDVEEHQAQALAAVPEAAKVADPVGEPQPSPIPPAAVAEPSQDRVVPQPSQAIAEPALARTRRGGAGHTFTLIRAMNVSPWAEVVVDGSSLGYTARTWKVAPGHHHLLLRNGKAGIEREFDLDFPSGGEVQLRGPLRSLQPELIR
jgi:serine/threonine protein kinase